jgi:hypothetical protein
MNDIVAELADGSPNRLFMPEHRQIELYSKRRPLHFAEQTAALPLAQLAGAARAFMFLDSYLSAQIGQSESNCGWQFYLGLPRKTASDKAIAQMYRILRVIRIVLFHPQGQVSLNDGTIRLKGIVGPTALLMDISASGLTLLESAVSYYLKAVSSPYPAAYIEAMIGEYFFDIVAEIKRFEDEGRALYQFQRVMHFSRHFRFECDNPKIKRFDEVFEFEVGAAYRDGSRYPIDFFAEVEDCLHIIPTEALKGFRISTTELAKWKAVTPDGATLPSSFRMRFGREVTEINQPMS